MIKFLNNILKFFIGTKHERDVKALSRIVKLVNILEASCIRLDTRQDFISKLNFYKEILEKEATVSGVFNLYKKEIEEGIDYIKNIGNEELQKKFMDILDKRAEEIRNLEAEETFKNILLVMFGDEKKELLCREYIERVESLRERDNIIEEFEDAYNFYEGYIEKSKDQKLDLILPGVYSLVREASLRILGLRHFDVQIMGGIVLHQGKIAEMKTGEGKTLAATLPLILNSLTGNSSHLITVNEYLAKRDSAWMGQIYNYLGLSCGYLYHDMSIEEKRRVYGCDIIYGTNSEFGFDYLRDNMGIDMDMIVQKSHYFAIVDEVDSILIDEARTPLIISGPTDKTVGFYYDIDRAVKRLKKAVERKDSEGNVLKDENEKPILDGDFELDEKTHTVALTESGVEKMEKLLNIHNLFAPKNMHLVHHIIQSIRAHHLYKRDVAYIIKDGKVIIVDEFTGRLMPGRRFGENLHQAIEAKEGVKIEQENQTLATITIQNYFRLYDKLAGMTGTADTEATEFKQIYNLDVVVIPTNQPMIRNDYDDSIYRTEEEKFNAVVKRIKELNEKGQPVLVGTISIEKSEKLSGMLERTGVKHYVLNAKHHEKEAIIITRAGQKGAVTIATNMAGRGTDIMLGEGVKELGGLFILGTERHESRRIDNQLRGRAGRQGDEGASKFYVSLEDDLMRLFGSDKISGLLLRLGMEKGQEIKHPWISKAIAKAQAKVENINFEIRKHLLEYDDVMNEQRKVIYSERRKALLKENVKEYIIGMLEDLIEEWIKEFIDEKLPVNEWKLDEFFEHIKMITNLDLTAFKRKLLEMDNEQAIDEIYNIILNEYEKKEKAIGAEVMRNFERNVMLQVVDQHWKDHLYTLDNLKEGINLRAYGQKDPLIEYKMEAFDMFQNMIESIKENIIRFLFKLQVASEEELKLQQIFGASAFKHEEVSAFERQKQSRSAEPGAPVKSKPIIAGKKPGRNEPCPCGSGKKYKKCCAKNE